MVKAGSNEKVYNGKIFKRHSSKEDGSVFPNKTEAEKVRKKLEGKGYNARKQYRKRQKIWLVWKRKKSSK